MRPLRNGDRYHKRKVPMAGGGASWLADPFPGPAGGTLVDRGAWWASSTAQRSGFAAARASLDALDVKVLALPREDEYASSGQSAKSGRGFPIGDDQDADQVGLVSGSGTNGDPKHQQPTAFGLTAGEPVLGAAHATRAIARLVASELVEFGPSTKSGLGPETPRRHGSADMRGPPRFGCLTDSMRM